jgi:DNA-directed RNA polymerase specialized sigma24 family protein
MKFVDNKLLRALKELPGKLRTTLLLIDVRQFKEDKVARMMDVPVEIVKNRTALARIILRRNFLP